MAAHDTNDPYWEGEKVRLRPMRKEDVALWLEEDVDSEGIRLLNYGIDLPKSPKSAEAFSERYSEFNHLSERILFSMETLSGELVGGINIHSMNRKNGTFQTGTRVYRSFRGRGFAADAKRFVLRYAFNELRFQKYNLQCIETVRRQTTWDHLDLFAERHFPDTPPVSGFRVEILHY